MKNDQISACFSSRKSKQAILGETHKGSSCIKERIRIQATPNSVRQFDSIGSHVQEQS